jgi:hypothetical protein
MMHPEAYLREHSLAQSNRRALPVRAIREPLGD